MQMLKRSKMVQACVKAAVTLPQAWSCFYVRHVISASDNPANNPKLRQVPPEAADIYKDFQ